MKLKIVALAFLALCLQSCDFEVVEIRKLEDRGPSPTHDLCTELCSVLLDDQSCYNTNEGTAELYIPVPKGNSLKFKRHSSNDVFFVSEATSSTGPAGNDIYYVKLAGLKKVTGAELGIYVDIKSGLSCLSRLTDDKKGSVISGYPIVDPNCKVECVDHP